jgi:nitrite reductase (NADH) small subunit
MNWIRITKTENIPLREGRSVRIGDHEIAIFNLGNRFAAIDNDCPHRGGPMCDGIVSGSTVVCPLHGWKISLDSGAVLRPEVCVRVETYPVRVIDGTIAVQLPAAKHRQEEKEKAA